MNVPEPNIPLLRKAVEWAEAEAAKTDGTCLWDQAFYVAETFCGTSYCIAGFVAAVSPEVTMPNLAEGWGGPIVNGAELSWHATGQQLLGLSNAEAYALFLDTNSIELVREVAEGIAARAGERL